MEKQTLDAGEIDRRLARFRDACKKAGVKLTQQRLEIFQEAARSLDHPDAESLFTRVRRRLPTVSLDTVYRTLWFLVDLGVIAPLGHSQERMRFDANMDSHHHFVCTRCGLTRDIPSAGYQKPEAPPVVLDLGRVEQTVVEYRGVCAECAKEKRATGAGDSSSHQP